MIDIDQTDAAAHLFAQCLFRLDVRSKPGLGWPLLVVMPHVDRSLPTKACADVSGAVEEMAADMAVEIGDHQVTAIPPRLPKGVVGSSVTYRGIGVRAIVLHAMGGDNVLRFDVGHA